MEWKFRKNFEVMPGILLKYGNQGLQISITYSFDEINNEKEKLKHQLFKPYHISDEIKSASIDQLTSNELKEFKQVLFKSDQLFSETKSLVESKRKKEILASQKLRSLQKSLFRFLFKKKIVSKEAELSTLREEIDELEQQLNYSIVKLEVDCEDIYKDLYRNTEKAFQLLTQSEKKWDITSSKATNRVAERTLASSTITRTEIKLSEKNLPILQYENKALCFHNINGGDLYLYPGFLIIYESKTNFAIINYTDFQIHFSQSRFIETEKVPTDSNLIGKTWLKVNKDGSPDKRFASNYQIPIVQYGEVYFKSNTGLNEVYCFSNFELAMLFQKALFDYVDTLNKAKALLNAFN